MSAPLGRPVPWTLAGGERVQAKAASHGLALEKQSPDRRARRRRGRSPPGSTRTASASRQWACAYYINHRLTKRSAKGSARDEAAVHAQQRCPLGFAEIRVAQYRGLGLP